MRVEHDKENQSMKIVPENLPEWDFLEDICKKLGLSEGTFLVNVALSQFGPVILRFQGKQ